MARLFGTDGVRGLANGEVLTASLALDLSVSAARVLMARRSTGRRPVAVVGRDTRISGHFLGAAVVAGLSSAGIDVIDLGVLPTPGIAYLTDAMGADIGCSITASHNPMPDNGIKFMAHGGFKLDDDIEDDIEALLGNTDGWVHPTGGDVGTIAFSVDAVERYVEHLTSSVAQPLTGLTVVVDCSQGAASVTGPLTLERAGATVVPLFNTPTGLDINDGCGATHTEGLQKAVVEHGADCGFAFDGDADRCIAVDAAGNVVDGDQLIAIIATSLKERGELVHDTVVVTVMSNLGFAKAMEAQGITVRRTAVGDRYVAEDMRDGGFVVGGEQSGHIIQTAWATTGDGTLTALHVLERMKATGRSLADLASVMTRYPQVLVNVKGVDHSRATEEDVTAAVQAEEAALAGRGRVLVRPSGTEPLVRVMVEAESQAEAQAVAERLAAVVSTD